MIGTINQDKNIQTEMNIREVKLTLPRFCLDWVNCDKFKKMTFIRESSKLKGQIGEACLGGQSSYLGLPLKIRTLPTQTLSLT